MNISFSCIDSRVEKNKNIYGRFILAPFVPGQAVTLANGLRRCLLSEVYGVAITAIEINGITHEYSTITGIRESVLDILLNVKKIVLTSELQFQRPQIAFLQVQGPGIVRASDIKLPISIQNVNPEQHIATLLYDGVLNIKFMICCGKNFLVQTPRGLKTPKVLNQTISQTIKDFKTTIQTKKKDLIYTKFSTFLKKYKNLDQNLVNKPKVFYKKAGKAMSDFVLTSLSVENKDKKKLVRSNKKYKHIKKIEMILFLDSLTEFKNNPDFPDSSNIPYYRKKRLFLSNKSIFSYRNYLLTFCKKKKKDFVFTEYFLQLKEKRWQSYLPIDAVFAPVSRVNFAIENNDLSNTPKERINLEIWTNGSLHPIQAIIEAAKAFTNITLVLKQITNNKCLFINSPNNFINVLLFKKSLEQLAKRNKEIQKQYLKIKTQNKQRVGGVKTSEDGVPELGKKKIPVMSVLGEVEWLDPNDPTNRSKLTVDVDKNKKIVDAKKSKRHTKKFKKEWLNPFKPGKEKIQLKKGYESVWYYASKYRKAKLRGGNKLKLEWVTRVRTIREFVNMLPQQKISTKLAKNLTIACEKTNINFNQFNPTTDIGNLNLSLRPYTCLKQAKIENLGDLLQKSAEDLLNLKNFGKHSLNEVENTLNQYNLKLSSQKIKNSSNK